MTLPIAWPAGLHAGTACLPTCDGWIARCGNRDNNRWKSSSFAKEAGSIALLANPATGPSPQFYMPVSERIRRAAKQSWRGIERIGERPDSPCSLGPMLLALGADLRCESAFNFGSDSFLVQPW
jgi:hypothetical protein